MNIDMKYVIHSLETILNIPSPSGNTKEIIEYVHQEIKKLGVKTYLTPKGALVATIDGNNNDYHRTISGHVDTLGAMVKEMKQNGRIKLAQIGGYNWNSIEGEYCTIETSNGNRYTGTIVTTKASSHVHGAESAKLERKQETMEVRLDEKVGNKADVEALGIDIGDFIFLDPRAQVTSSGFIKSRHLDDKAGVAAILGTIKYIKDNNITLKQTTNFFISNYEEVGHGAASDIPEKTLEFIAIDMAAPGEGQSSDEYSVTICAKDSSGPYDYELRKRLVSIAKENNIDYKIDIYPFYGSDASAALRAGWGFKHGLIGPGVDASHSHERTHKDAIEKTIKLCVNYLLK